MQGPVHEDRDLRVTVTYAGTRGLHGFRLVAHLAQKIGQLPPNSVILLRRGKTTPPGTFEAIVEAIATSIGLTVEYRVPQDGDRGSVFRRDYQMVDDSNYVEAYFPLHAIMEGGTGHVVDAALGRDKQVYAWSVDPEGRIGRIGELEPTSFDGRSAAW